MVSNTSARAQTPRPLRATTCHPDARLAGLVDPHRLSLLGLAGAPHQAVDCPRAQPRLPPSVFPNRLSYCYPTTIFRDNLAGSKLNRRMTDGAHNQHSETRR